MKGLWKIRWMLLVGLSIVGMLVMLPLPVMAETSGFTMEKSVMDGKDHFRVPAKFLMWEEEQRDKAYKPGEKIYFQVQLPDVQRYYFDLNPDPDLANPDQHYDEGDVRLQVYMSTGERASLVSINTLEMTAYELYTTYAGMSLTTTFVYEYTIPSDGHSGTIGIDQLVLSEYAEVHAYEGQRFEDYQITYDGIKPSIQVSPERADTMQTSHDITLVDVSDDSGIAYIAHRWTTSPVQPAAAEIVDENLLVGESIPAFMAGSGHYYLHILARDTFDNERISTYGPYAFDQDPPEVTFHYEDGYEVSSTSAGGTHYEGTAMKVKVSSADAHTELTRLEYRWQESDAFIELADQTQSIAVPPIQGMYRLTVRAEDAVGNVNVVQSVPFVVDTTGPEIVKLGHYTNYASMTVRSQEDIYVYRNELEQMKVYGQWSTSLLTPEASDPGWTETTAWSYTDIQTRIWSFEGPPQEEGTWYLHAMAVDRAGNVTLATNVDEPFIFTTHLPELAVWPNGTNEQYINDDTIEEIIILFDGRPAIESDGVRYTFTDLAGNPMPDAGPPLSHQNSHYVGPFSVYDEDPTRNLFIRNGVFRIQAETSNDLGETATFLSEPFYLDNSAPAVHQLEILWDEMNVVFAPKFSKYITNDTEVPIDLSGVTDEHVQSIQPSGIAEYQYKIEYYHGPDLVSAESEWMPYTGDDRAMLSLDLNGEPLVNGGQYNISINVRDAAGNASGYQTVPASVFYDNAPPDIYTITPDLPYATDSITVTISYSDQTTDHEVRQQQFTVTDNGTYEFQIDDGIGNIANVEVAVTGIDREPPQIEFLVSGLDSQKINPYIASSDESYYYEYFGYTAYDVGSGSDEDTLRYAWSRAPIPPSDEDWLVYRDGATIEPPQETGTWYLWASAEDRLGHVAQVVSEPYRLDYTEPTGTIIYSQLNPTAMPVTARLYSAEPVTITNNGGSDTYRFTDNGDFTFEFVDEARNPGTVTASVYWIDTSLPQAEVTISPSGWTNGAVVVTVNVENGPPRMLRDIVAPADAELIHLITLEYGLVTELVEGSTIVEAQYRLLTNGQLDFVIENVENGATQRETVIVDRIDHIAPTGKLSYSIDPSTWTREDVTVTLDVYDESSSATVRGPASYTFTENGSYTFEFEDEAGNVSTMTATVNRIDRSTPEPTIIYSADSWTNESVTATVTFHDMVSPIEIVNNGGSYSYTFDQNGEFTFRYRNAAGYTGEITAEVDWIDKSIPQASLTYSERTWTTEPVTVTLAFSDAGSPMSIINNGGSDTYTFHHNGEFTFQYRNAVGYVGEITARVDWIDRTPPVAEVVLSATGPTNAQVRAILFADEEIIVTNTVGGKRYYDFKDNGEFTFEFTDLAGNPGTARAKVDMIDRIPVTPRITYSTTTMTKGDVIATVEADEPFYVLNNYRNQQYVFQENGEFTFVISDLAGNTVEMTASVSNIDKSRADIRLSYSETGMTKNPVTVVVESDRELLNVRHTGRGTMTSSLEGDIQVTFTENGSAWLMADDALGNAYTIDVTVRNIDQTAPDIRFYSGDEWIIPQGVEMDLTAGVQAVDLTEGDVTAKLIVQHDIDVAKPGEYTVTYRVTDLAGNVAVKTRIARVVAPDALSVYVNGKSTETGIITMRGTDQLFFLLMGEQGDIERLWQQGNLPQGYFKAGGRDLEEWLMIDQPGYYSFYVQDDERNTRYYRVFVISLTD